MLEPILPYAVQAGQLSLEAFAERFPDPVLVFEPFAEGEAGTFETVGGSGGPGGGTRQVGVLRKRPEANAVAMMITIGRARNNDIQLLAQGVSKFHAYVTYKEGVPTLVDAGSTLGTYEGGRRLPPRGEPVALRDGAELRFGTVVATFLRPPALHAYLNALG